MTVYQSALLFVLCVNVLLCKCDSVNANCESIAMTTSMVLKKKLFCSYDTTVRPTKDHTTMTNVSTHLWLKYIVFNEHYNTLQVVCLMFWKWKDEFLIWDKNEYSGLDELNILSSEIWVPDVTVYTTADMNSVDTRMSETKCVVQSDGQVACVSPTHTTAICIPDITRWPFDSHNCTMRMGSWSHPGNLMNISTDEEGISTDDYIDNRDWELIGSNATRMSMDYKNVSYPWITYSFELKRHPGGQVSSVVAPSIVLAVVTLVTFWLDPVHSHRFGLICVNITCHCLYMMFLCMMLPGNGESTPIIVTFFRDSLLLAGISLLVSVCAGRMNTTARAPPMWVVSVTDGVLSSAAGQVFLLGETDPKVVAAAKGAREVEDSSELIGTPTTANGWRSFSTLLDRVCFLVFSITLVILLCAFVP